VDAKYLHGLEKSIFFPVQHSSRDNSKRKEESKSIVSITNSKNKYILKENLNTN
jgi:hypothetical protein